MRDWLKLAAEAADKDDAIAAICFLEAERENSRLDHEWQIAEFRRSIQDAQEWKQICESHRAAHAGEAHDPFCLSSDTRLCESSRMVTQPLGPRHPGG